MSLLLYCVIEAAATADPPATGVRGAAVQGVEAEGLRCFYSEVQSLQGDSSAIQQDAIAFHQVIHRIFTAATLLPFRYPTLLPELAEVGAHLRRRAAQYNAALSRLQGLVQMDARVAWAGAPQATGGGADYLRSKAAQEKKINASVAALRVASGSKVLDWRQRAMPQGTRGSALLRRQDVGIFQQELRQLRLDPEVSLTVSGPWPPTEFLPDFDE